MGEGAVEAGAEPGMPINPAFEEQLRSVMVNDAELGEISVYDLVLQRIDQMAQLEPAFEPFTGPLSDCQGNEILAEGASASIPDLLSLQWAAAGISGPWAGGATPDGSTSYDTCN